VKPHGCWNCRISKTKCTFTSIGTSAQALIAASDLFRIRSYLLAGTLGHSVFSPYSECQVYPTDNVGKSQTHTTEDHPIRESSVLLPPIRMHRRQPGFDSGGLLQSKVAGGVEKTQEHCKADREMLKRLDRGANLFVISR
jgi:hypothetical protein